MGSLISDIYFVVIVMGGGRCILRLNLIVESKFLFVTNQTKEEVFDGKGGLSHLFSR